MTEADLIRWVRAEIGRPFVWGETNCVALAVRCLDAQGGTDILPRHARHMSTERRALAWTRKHGVAGLLQILRAEGLAPVAPAFAQTGDVLLGETADGQIAAHIVVHDRLLSALPEVGVRLFRHDQISPMERYAMGWRRD